MSQTANELNSDCSTVVIYVVKGLRNQNKQTKKSSIKKWSMKADKQIVLEALGKQILRWRLYRKITGMEMENKSWLSDQDGHNLWSKDGIRNQLCKNTTQSKPGL